MSLTMTGYLVIMPDYYRGEMCDPFKDGAKVPDFVKKHTQWANLKADWDNKVRPYAEKNGAQVYGAVGTKIMNQKKETYLKDPLYFIGTCWGSYPVVKLSADVAFKAGVSMHPSHTFMCEVMGESEEAALKEVKCNQLFMPANGDSPTTMPDGLGKKVMGDMLEVVTFPDMNHGWSIRGDLSEANVERDVQKAFNLLLNFFRKYL